MRSAFPFLPALVVVALHGSAIAQPGASAAGATVVWSAPATVAKAKPGTRIVVTLRGEVREGWHLYGLKQRDLGPTPLRVTLDATDLARADGPPSGTRPVVAHDPVFGFVAPYYAGAFTIGLPVRVSRGATAGRQAVQVSVRFQTCNGTVCQPPKTVRLSAPIDVAGGG